MQISNFTLQTPSDRNLLKKRLKIDSLLNQTTIVSGDDVIEGLTQTPKTLPPKYFYDDRGSLLFEKICELPEYYLTRTETSILQQYASEIAHLTGPCELVELGSGSSTKTRILLDAYQELGHPLHYLPIDISGGILEESSYSLLADYPTLHIHGIVSTYETALKHLNACPLPTRMISFIGSTLGNLTSQDCEIFFSHIVEALQPGDYFLLGIDLHKSKEILEPAYNDAQGVTAEFNLNMLQHLNRLYEGNFNEQQFEHLSFYNQDKHQIEMHLKSLRSQTVELHRLNLTVEFAENETIHTEISRKFEIKPLQTELQQLGLIPVQAWTDENQWFGLLLFQFKP